MEIKKEQIYFKKLMQPFVDLGCEIKFNPTRVILPGGVELYKEEENDR